MKSKIHDTSASELVKPFRKNNFLTMSNKTILAVAFLAVAMVSCQDKTKDKVEEATEAIGEDVEQKIDTLSAKTDKVIDTVQAKTGEALEKSAEKIDEAADKLKEASKK